MYIKKKYYVMFATFISYKIVITLSLTIIIW